MEAYIFVKKREKVLQHLLKFSSYFGEFVRQSMPVEFVNKF